MIHPTRYKARLWYLPLQGPAILRRTRYINAPTNPQKTAEAAFGNIRGGRYRVDYVPVTCEELGMVELPPVAA